MQKNFYFGYILCQICVDMGLIQVEFVKKFGLFMFYVNQIENNNWLVMVLVLFGINWIFGIDLVVFEDNDFDWMIQDFQEIFIDMCFYGIVINKQEFYELVICVFQVVRVIMDMYGIMWVYQEKDVGVDDFLQMNGLVDGIVGISKLVYEEVWDYFYYLDNYVDSFDWVVEFFVVSINCFFDILKLIVLIDWLSQCFQISVDQYFIDDSVLICYDEFNCWILLYWVLLDSVKVFFLGMVIVELYVGELLIEEVMKVGFRI